jgi:DNA polymerase
MVREGPLPEEGIRYSAKKTVQSGLFGKEPGPGDEDLDSITFDELEAAVAACRKCGLHEGRTKAVFGAGDRSAKIVFIGEAPGREEDLQGVPFVGRAGKLLDKILAAIEFSREDVYIANILKCRPPGNRDPNEEEVAACEGYLKRQLELIDPVVICALGRVAAQNLLKTKSPLGKMRGKIHYYNDIKTVVTYHPAALLRNPHFKRPAWEDMKMLRSIYDESSP